MDDRKVFGGSISNSDVARVFFRIRVESMEVFFILRVWEIFLLIFYYFLRFVGIIKFIGFFVIFFAALIICID